MFYDPFADVLGMVFALLHDASLPQIIFYLAIASSRLVTCFNSYPAPSPSISPCPRNPLTSVRIFTRNKDNSKACARARP